jgi:hypothetical protein
VNGKWKKQKAQRPLRRSVHRLPFTVYELSGRLDRRGMFFGVFFSHDARSVKRAL